jgi:hypothetical protein
VRTTLLLLALVGCASSGATAPGPLGRVDLKPKLPEGVVKGSEDPTAEHERSAEICGSDGSPGARMKLRWQTFSQGQKRYIAGYDVELVKAADGVKVKLGEPRVGGSGDGTATADPNVAYVATATIPITCTKDGADFKRESIQIAGDGKTAQ